MSSRSTARRAVLRWAWRLFRREWRQQVLVLSLITIAIAAAVAGASILVNGATPDSDGLHGDATGLTQIESRDPDYTARVVRTAQRRFGTVEVIAHRNVALPGSVKQVDLREQNPKGVFSHSTLALTSGRYPAATNEVALTDDVMTLLAVRVGQHVTLGRTDWTVVGTVENPHKLDDSFGVATGIGAAPDRLTLLFDMHQEKAVGPPAAGDDNVGLSVFGRSDDRSATESIVMVAVTLAMTLVALIAAAGFVVVAQRRQRQLGLLAATGAETRHLRLVMVANGLFVGVVAAAVGTALGVLGWFLASPAVESAANHRIGTFELPWSLIVRCALIGVGMSTLASWWPTRVITRLPIMTALSGRPPKPASVHRSVAAGVVFAAAGVGLMTKSNATGHHVHPLFIMTGLVSLIAAVVFLAPAAVRVLGRLAPRLPFTTRLALRDLVRYNARAAASLAAIALVLGITITILGISKATEFRADEGNLAANQVWLRPGGDGPAASPVLTPEQMQTAAARVADALGGARSVALDSIMDPAAIRNGEHMPIQAVIKRDAHSFEGRGTAYVATPEVFAFFGIDASSIRPDTQLITGTDEPLQILGMASRDDISRVSQTQHVALPQYQDAPHNFVPPAVVAAHGWTPRRDSYLLTTAKPLTTEQIAAARAAAASAGMAIEVRDAQDDIAAIRSIFTSVGMLVALGIAAMTVGLIRSESARDIRTLTATGASPRARRAITASTTGALATLGVVLGGAGAYAALIAAYHSQLDKLAPPPLLQLAMLGLGLPVVATLAGWLVAGREPTTFARQALD